MAVSKLWPVTVRLATVLDYASNPEKTTKSKSKYSDADYQALRDVVNYVKNGEKTEQELFCEGINCTSAIAREQFVTVKEQFDKTDGIQAYHGYLSFKETDITPELAQHIGIQSICTATLSSTLFPLSMGSVAGIPRGLSSIRKLTAFVKSTVSARSRNRSVIPMQSI